MVVVTVFVAVVVVTSMIVMSVTSHHDVEFKVFWVSESIFALCLNVKRHVAHWWVFPCVQVFDEVFQFAHVEQPVAIHVGFVEHFHDHFFFMFVVCVMVVVIFFTTRSAVRSSPHQACSLTVSFSGVAAVDGVG